MLAVAVASLALTTCGGRVSPPTDVAGAVLTGITALPLGNLEGMERYGYDLGDDAVDDFFTEVEFARSDDVTARDVIEAVRDELGPGWDVTDVVGGGCCVEARFASGTARVELTTWNGGFDVTVAPDGERLAGTRLDLG